MRQTDREENRNPDRGIGAGTAAVTDTQRDGEKDVKHMPRHWQGSGERGETPGQTPPGPDMREPGRANQYGEAGEAASRQVHEELTEHGRELSPQRRENKQLPRRPGERSEDQAAPEEP